MPELPEVETTRRGLEKAAKGKKITHVTVRRRDLRFPIPKGLEMHLAGATIADVRRRAKYLLIDMVKNGEKNGKNDKKSQQTGILLVHLGMSGSLTLQKSPKNGLYTPKTHDHVLFYLENDRLIAFHDPRRFGVIDWLEAGSESTHALLAHLGPEPLSATFSPAYLSAALARRKGPIKSALMDQRLVVGVGNIYASESLYLSNINPNVAAYRCVARSEAIICAIADTLNAAIASGGSTLRDYVGAQNEGGYFQHHFNVYGRDGEPCFRCSTIIQTTTHAGRSTYWCPQCQR